jgi:hypothetical protein
LIAPHHQIVAPLPRAFSSMKGSITTNPATETFGQARQGSVAAIIQVLNERLIDSGIRTRAVVADGMLQLLCEAASPEQLDKSRVVARVRKELEAISPQRIKKVTVHSRIVREEQLLWLEEINRDPENAVLWSEVMTLNRPFFLKRWLRDRHLKPAGPIFKDITKPEPSASSLSSKLIAGASLGLLLIAAGWLFREDFSPVQSSVQTDLDANSTAITATPEDMTPVASSDNVTAPIAPSVPGRAPGDGDALQGNRTADTTPTPPATQLATPSVNPTTTKSATKPNASSPPVNSRNAGNVTDAFAEAVRIAEQASLDGQTASSAADWLDLAARWQKASDLMGNIPAGNEQYAIAQDRIKVYQTNSQSALKQASSVQTP